MEIKFGKNLLDDFAALGLTAPVKVILTRKDQALARKLGPVCDGIGVFESLERKALTDLAEKLAGAATVLAIGGGPVAHAGRFVALASGANLAVLATEITGEAIVTERAVVWDDGLPALEGDKEPDLILLDPTLIWDRNEDLSRAGVGDALAIVTAIEDWRNTVDAGFTEEQGATALEVVDELLDWADDINDLTEAGIKRLVELLYAREELVQRLRRRRVIEGPERALYEYFQWKAKNAHPHGPLKCLCVVMAACLMGMNAKPVKQFLHWIRVYWQPEKLGLTDADLTAALTELPAFIKERGLYGDLVEGPAIIPDHIKRTIHCVREPLVKTSLQR